MLRMMHENGLRYALLLLFICPAAPALGELLRAAPDEWVTVPGKVGLQYQYRDDGDGRELVAIRYWGPPEWLVEQRHRRSRWHELPSLEAISFDSTSITREQMEYIAQIETLQYLEFRECIYEDHDTFAPLERMRWLKGLEIDFFIHEMHADEPPDAEFFEFLEGLVNLEDLNLWRVAPAPIDEQTFRRITQLENLKGLTLRLEEMGPDAMRQIENLTQLEFLFFDGVEDPSPLLEGLRDHPRLTRLSFGARKLDEDDVAALASLTSLEDLSMNGTSAASLAPFERLANLRELTLRFREYEDGFGWLRNAPQLEVLRVWGSAAEQVPLEALRGHEGIRELILPNVTLSEDDIDILKSMPNLEELMVDTHPTSVWYHAAKRRLPDLEIPTR